jgi:hypothetical protein
MPAVNARCWPKFLDDRPNIVRASIVNKHNSKLLRYGRKRLNQAIAQLLHGISSKVNRHNYRDVYNAVASRYRIGRPAQKASFKKPRERGLVSGGNRR